MSVGSADVRSLALRTMAVMAFATIVSQFLRSANAVIAPDLMKALDLGPGGMGILTGAYFGAFALVQIPYGLMFDRYGVRWTIAGMTTVAVIGTFWFSLADGFGELVAARALMGVGVAGPLMGGFILVTRWWPPGRFGRVAGTYAALSNSGNLFATAPLAAATVLVGWRGAFAGVAVLLVVSAILVALMARDAPPGHAFHHRRPESIHAAFRGVLEALRVPNMGRIYALGVVVLGTQLAILSLWAGPYFADVHGLDTVARGNALLALATCGMLGTFAYGQLERVIASRKRIVCVGAIATLILLVILTLWPQPPLAVAVVLLALFGFAASYAVALTAYARGLFPDRLMGRGITVVNVAVVSGIAIMQILTGIVLGFFPIGPDGSAPELAYRAVFLFLAVATALALLVFLGVRDIAVTDAAVAEKMP